MYLRFRLRQRHPSGFTQEMYRYFLDSDAYRFCLAQWNACDWTYTPLDSGVRVFEVPVGFDLFGRNGELLYLKGRRS